MPGDYTRFTFDPARRYAAVRLQQGRVQLDSDWNEGVDILRERTRLLGLDAGGPAWVANLTTPDAFKVGKLAGPPADLSLGVGRLYLDGRLAEILPGESVSYLHQPFLPAPPAYNPAVNTLVYLDLWERDVTAIEDAGLIDKALGGVDTATRTQQVWQLKLHALPGVAATCGVNLDALFPPSGGRLTTSAVAPPAPSDPCILPPNAGYRGIENRLYRVEIQRGGALGAAMFKWSRDNGAIVSRVSGISVAAGQTRVSVERIGRDKTLRFRIGQYVTLTDDHRELNGEAGEMARIVDLDEAARVVVLDRALPSVGGRAFGANAVELTARHTRLQRWDQNAPLNAVDADGLMTTAAGPIELEDGVRVSFSTAPGGGPFRIGDYWVFAARVADASVEPLNQAPPRGLRHQYLQLAAIPAGGTPTDCRPKPEPEEEECCCLVVAPGESIQDAIDSLPAAGGCICLKAGLHVIERPLHIKNDNITLHGESLGALVSMRRAEPILVAEKTRGLRLQQISFRAEQGAKTAALLLLDCRNSAITDCTLTLEKEEEESIGLHAVSSAGLNLDALRVGGFSIGLWFDEGTSDVAVERCQIHLPKRAPDKMTLIGLLATHGHGALRVDNNTVLGAHSGIVLNDTPGDKPASRLIAPLIRGNTLELLRNPGKMGRTYGIDCAAPCALVEGNALGHEGGTFTAIRLTGDAATARDNLIVSRARQLGLTLAISVGDTLKKIPVPVADVTLAGNRIFGLQHGILAQWVSKGVVEANLLGTIQALQGAGVTLVSCADTLVRANEIGAALFGVSSMRGARNRFEANVINAGDAGVAVLQELAPTIAGNRITGCTLGGIALVVAAGRCESVGNRVVNCGAEGKPGVGIGALNVLGEWHVEGNEVMDTGLPVEKGGPEAALAYGVAGAMVLEARVSNNLITYSDILRRPVTSEDRALLLMGYLDMQLDDRLTFGFPVNIAGNSFLGASASHLVELVELAFSPQFAMRFERVFFSGNDCVHLCPEPNDKSATVSLVGRACTVSANQVKPTSKGYRSFDFHGMPGPYMGNVTGGDTLGRPAAQEFPAPQSAYNMIF